jgi:hypothetical protein
MAVSPSQWLYRIAGQAVILASLTLLFLQTVSAQVGRHSTASKGPRALGLLELAANGKAHLIPVTIMYEGKFYDASAYKASPVPMALESGTVYEAVRTGISQGLFTVAGASQTKEAWIGEGTWQSASAIAAAATAKKNKPPTNPPPSEDLDAPPVLRRSDSEKPKSAPTAPAAPPQTVPQASPPATSSPVPSAASAPPTVEEDNDRPPLRRGKPTLQEKPGTPTGASAEAGSHAPAIASTTAASVQIIPAISDADGPDPRPYAYSLKPEEEQQFRKKMLALAADEVRARARLVAPETFESPSSAPRIPRHGKAASAVKSPTPTFEEVQLRIFDLSNSNEPVLVLTTNARMPQPPSRSVDLQYYVALVAHEDLYRELHKAFSNVTDTLHLDVLPRLEFIDAVDADGDGRGELLFRQTSDAGSAFAVYRVIGDQLWPLFQGMPGQ